MSPEAFSSLFLAAAALTLFARLVLNMRQIGHVRAHREAVPPPFAESISLESHRKAADYTVARMQLGTIDAAIGTAYVLALTLGGGLQAIHDALTGIFAAGTLAHGVALLAALGIAGWAIELPFSLYRTFGIEKRFGFNRMTPGLYLADLGREAMLAALIGLPLIAAVLWLMGAMGERWWLWVWLFWLAFNLLALFIWPTFIAPLFN
ncbi:MAG: M48 family metallopeptidase, partial [Pseudomonas sp.]|nr:M48 family metallopeptidase [Pseudomonas sp.]